MRNPFATIRERRRERLMKRDETRFKAEYYRTAQLSYPPRHATLTVASYCAFKCQFCAYHSPDAAGKSNVYDLRFKLSFKDFVRMVDMCYDGRVPSVHICATGEPFFHNDILRMVDYVIERYGHASVQTDLCESVFEKKGYLEALRERGRHISYITTDVLSGIHHVHNEIKKGSSFDYVMHAMAYLSQHTPICFHVHYILTKHNYEHIARLIDELSGRRINCRLDIVNLQAHDFNEFTSPKSLYLAADTDITEALRQAKEYGREKGISVTTPTPVDGGKSMCGAFWSRIQTWPVKGIDQSRYGENVIVGGCNAVVLGKLNSLGYLFDYENIMQLWNNYKYLQIRSNLLNGIYPDSECRLCQNYDWQARPACEHDSRQGCAQ